MTSATAPEHEAEQPAAPVGRSRSVGAIFFDLLLIAFVALIVITALDLRLGARMVPLAVGIPTLVLLLIQLAIDLRGEIAQPHPGLAETDLASASIGEVIDAARGEELEEVVAHSPEQLRREAGFAVWAIGYAVLGIVTNFLIASPIAVAAILLTQFRPVPALIAAGMTGLAVWAVFDLFLQVRF